MMCREMLNAIDTHKLFDQEDGKRVFSRFRQNLGGAALDAWDDVTNGVHRSKRYFKGAIKKLVEEMLHNEA